jgi:hypothetical protein
MGVRALLQTPLLRSTLITICSGVSNQYNITFWILAHILYDEPLLQLVKQETEAAWRSGQLDLKYLAQTAPALMPSSMRQCV